MFFIGEMIITNDRYLMTETENSMYAVQMTLMIRKIQKSDMGGYKCISKNSIGDAEGTIRLYGEQFTRSILNKWKKVERKEMFLFREETFWSKLNFRCNEFYELRIRFYKFSLHVLEKLTCGLGLIDICIEHR